MKLKHIMEALLIISISSISCKRSPIKDKFTPPPADALKFMPTSEKHILSTFSSGAFQGTCIQGPNGISAVDERGNKQQAAEGSCPQSFAHNGVEIYAIHVCARPELNGYWIYYNHMFTKEVIYK